MYNWIDGDHWLYIPDMFNTVFRLTDDATSFSSHLIDDGVILPQETRDVSIYYTSL